MGSKRRAPSRTLEGRENQMIDLAIDLAEQQLRDGTASSQIVAHFLKLGTTREKLEQERLTHENNLLQAKTQAIEAQQEIKSLFEDAIRAMHSYGGQEEEDFDAEIL